MTDAIADVARVRGLLIDAARRSEAISYSAILADLGHRFTRPKMRALCRRSTSSTKPGEKQESPNSPCWSSANRMDCRGKAGGSAGWLSCATTDGPWEGPKARALVDGLQREAFAYWADR